ncbi:hypothetical protein [uncultured Variovorax sp.]|uniref:hypothetical protein n=1 Tax=uncultured Variovorax sp. TaxID=114708 RepID=UPI0025D7DC84|nr:hypothetical protein [uncultured Variovorax sp.]
MTQKNSGSVFSMVASTLCTGVTLPSGTARMRTGISPPRFSISRSQPSRLKGSPCTAMSAAASSTSSRVTGVCRYSRR